VAADDKLAPKVLLSHAAERFPACVALMFGRVPGSPGPRGGAPLFRGHRTSRSECEGPAYPQTWHSREGWLTTQARSESWLSGQGQLAG
jgi:hypothetical protein